MIYFVLAVLVCTAPEDCHWYRKGAFRSEEGCHNLGQIYMFDMHVKRYRCVIQASDGPARHG